jgi:hypothetical protein
MDKTCAVFQFTAYLRLGPGIALGAPLNPQNGLQIGKGPGPYHLFALNEYNDFFDLFVII